LGSSVGLGGLVCAHYAFEIAPLRKLKIKKKRKNEKGKKAFIYKSILIDAFFV
jgi:hypothetical protein